MKSICIFCGSSRGIDPLYGEKAKILAREIVKNNLNLIYGGGSVGIMGILADEVLRHKGRVTGVIPRFLYDLEVGHDGLTELLIVSSMHERKQRMAEIADSFLALPGGFGTLEETSEILTWVQLKLINKPVGLLNINGFFDPLLKWFDNMVKEGFLKQDNRDILLVGKEPGDIIQMLQKSPAFPSDKWVDKT